METKVRQTTYEKYLDTYDGEMRLNRRGEIVIADLFQQWVADGRCFIASPIAMETADKLGDDSYHNTIAGLAVDVPTGKTIKPLEIMLAQGGTVAGADVNVLMTLDDKVRITSGVVETPRNYLISDTWARGTACKVYSHEEGTTDLVVAANAEDNTFFGKMMAENLTGGDTQNVLWTARKYPAPWIKGPGSLVIHTYPASSTAPSFFWHIIYAEFDTTEVFP